MFAIFDRAHRLPVGLDRFGIGPTMGIGALTLLGFLVCPTWAPETTGQPLEDSAAPGRCGPRSIARERLSPQ